MKRNSKDYSWSWRDRKDSRSRDGRGKYKSPHPPRTKHSGSFDRSHSRVHRGHADNRSGFTSINFHITGPSNSTCCIDTGAQCSCIGQQTFVNLGGNLKSLSKSENSYIFGDGKPSPSLVRAKIEFNIDIVSRDIPGLIGMDIIDSNDRDRSIFHLDISERHLVDSGQCQD